VLVAVIFLVPPAAAQGDSIFSEFHFRDLKFEFWPSGVENRQSSDGSGSAITVHVNEVRVEGANAQELRHCIDADQSFCSYDTSFFNGNKDGKVTTDEVESFQRLAGATLKRIIPRVADLAERLQKNVTVDDKQAKAAASITKLAFQGAEGPTTSNATIIATIDAKVTYDNDGGAKKHDIAIGELSLKKELFFGQNVIWVTPVAGWGYDTKATRPDGAKSLVNSHGYFSSQAQFEDLAKSGLHLTAAKGAGSKKSPGPELGVVLAGLALLLMVGRRR
jgi:hypothetical protein